MLLTRPKRRGLHLPILVEVCNDVCTGEVLGASATTEDGARLDSATNVVTKSKPTLM